MGSLQQSGPVWYGQSSAVWSSLVWAWSLQQSGLVWYGPGVFSSLVQSGMGSLQQSGSDWYGQSSAGYVPALVGICVVGMGGSIQS